MSNLAKVMAPSVAKSSASNLAMRSVCNTQPRLVTGRQGKIDIKWISAEGEIKSKMK